MTGCIDEAHPSRGGAADKFSEVFCEKLLDCLGAEEFDKNFAGHCKTGGIMFVPLRFRGDPAVCTVTELHLCLAQTATATCTPDWAEVPKSCDKCFIMTRQK